MPRPRLTAPERFWSGWFDVVPAYRLATLRVLLAVITLVFHVPKFNRMIADYTASSFHVPPAFSWIPVLSPAGGMALMLAQDVAAWGLLLGWAPRLCAWLLAGAGFYVMSLDPEFFAHNAHFHLTLLALIGCSADRVSLRRLLAEDDAGSRCPAWPERLVGIQLAIVFFYAAVDKILSPYWGLSGASLAAQHLSTRGPAFDRLQRMNEAALPVLAGALSVVTIVLEGFVAAAFLIRALRPIGIVVTALFVLYLEFVLKPGAFAWDVLAALLVFVPAGDRAWQVAYDPACRTCRGNRALLSPLDWLRRLRWTPMEDATSSAARGELELVSPWGRVRSGFDALRVLPIALPGPFLLALIVARFGGGFLAARGYGAWDDLPFLMLLGWLTLWVPGLARVLGQPIYTTVSRAWDNWATAARPGGGADGSVRCSHTRGIRVGDASA